MCSECSMSTTCCQCFSCFKKTCSLQSAEAEVVVSETNAEIASFTDANDQMVATISPNVTDMTLSGLQTEGELSRFLSRPVRIATYNWLEATAPGYIGDFKPWHLYLNSTQVKSKLNNYTWFRGNLHIKFVVTASPFYYGLLMASYCPIQDAVDASAGTGTYAYMLRSQRPHVMITAADSKGGEMVLPFIYPKQFVNIKKDGDIQSLGLFTWQVLSQLRSANDVVGSGVSVQVYAWMEDVELHGPTVGLALQSDEYTEPGAISTLASSAAKIASKFTTWPLVGSFARATEVGATAIGSIASIFGFTNVPVLDAAIPVRPSPFPQLASTEIGYPVEKLTIDPKNELAIDGASASLKLEDELQISHWVQRESILNTSSFLSSDLVDAQLFRMCVTPDLWNRVPLGTHYVNYLTPLAFACQPFLYWRGDIIIRFDFIKSKYHRGRVIATWEPVATAGTNVSTVGDCMGRAITKVLDLGAESSLEITIPYNQASPWLELLPGYVSQYTLRGADVDEVNYDPDNHNGLLTLRVLNVLTAPVATSTVDFVVSIRGAENLEFAGPTALPNWSRFAPQSRVFEEPAQLETMGNTQTAPTSLYLATMGETIRSFRTLMRRSVLNEVSVLATNTTDEILNAWWIRTRFPLHPGYDPNGRHLARNNANTANVSYNWSHLTLYNYLAPCFAGVRGSMMWHLNAVNQSLGGNTPTPVRVMRAPGLTIADGTSVLTTKTGPNDARFFALTCNQEAPGAALTTTTTNQGLSVSIPNYTNALFQSTIPGCVTNPYTAGVIIPDSDRMATEVIYHPKLGQTTRAAFVERYNAIGTDLSLIYFINVPYWYEYRFEPGAAI